MYIANTLQTGASISNKVPLPPCHPVMKRCHYEIIAKAVPSIGLILVLLMTSAAWGQDDGSGLQIGYLTTHASGTFTGGYQGDYSSTAPSSHSLSLDGSGSINGYYYNPAFIAFNIIPYYGHTRGDSNIQTLSDGSGVSATASFFTRSRYPGSISYSRNSHNFHLVNVPGQPSFASFGSGTGFGIGWSALIPNWPTLSVSFSRGSGSGRVYGTPGENTSHNHNLTVRSDYRWKGWPLHFTYNRYGGESKSPNFLSGLGIQTANNAGQSFGVDTTQTLPLHGQIGLDYSRSSTSSEYSYSSGVLPGSSYSFTTNIANAHASFSPTRQFGFTAFTSYTGNLSGAVIQSLTTNGFIAPAVDFGAGSKSITIGGGARYLVNKELIVSANVNHVQQFFYGQSRSGTFLSGTLSYRKPIFHALRVGATILDLSNGSTSNALGFTGYVNYAHSYGRWATSGNFTYTQGAQTLLLTYTTSSYAYGARVARWLGHGMSWNLTMGGNRSGLSQHPGTSDHSETYNTSFAVRMLQVSAFYSKFRGQSLLGSGGLIAVNPTPGLPVSELIVSSGHGYGGAGAVTPIRHLSISVSYSRAFSHTTSQSIQSKNDTAVISAQLQYHFRRITIMSGVYRLQQRIGVAGPPEFGTSYYVGISRWFKFF